MTATVGDLLARIAQDRDSVMTLPVGPEKEAAARGVLMDAMFMLNKILGTELIAAAMGRVEEKDRVALLEGVARRMSIFGSVLGPTLGDSASPWRIAEEAMAVARGDAPLIFARLDGRKANHRILRAKREALMWDAYLGALGIRAGERQTAIASAFGSPWETIRRSWRRDVRATLPPDNTDYMIALAKSEGRAGKPRWEHASEPDWRVALNNDGMTYLRVLRENNGNGW